MVLHWRYGPIVVLNNALSPATGSYTSGGTLTNSAITEAVTSDGLGENMTVTDLGAGGHTYAAPEKEETVVQGSLFAWTNAGGTIKTVTEYVDSVAGSNPTITEPFNTQGQNPSTPLQTLDVATASMTNSGIHIFDWSNPGKQESKGCWSFQPANNTAGAVPIAIGQPFNFRGKNGTMSGSGAVTMIVNQAYWINRSRQPFRMARIS